MKSHTSWGKAVCCARAALDKKAYDLVILEVGAHTTVAEHFIICTGRSDIQVQSICRAIEANLSKEDIRPTSIEGYVHGQWVLMDFGDVIVHIFYETTREFYQLDDLWGQAPRCTLPEPYHTQAQDLRIAAGSSLPGRPPAAGGVAR